MNARICGASLGSPGGFRSSWTCLVKVENAILRRHDSLWRGARFLAGLRRGTLSHAGCALQPQRVLEALFGGSAALRRACFSGHKQAPSPQKPLAKKWISHLSPLTSASITLDPTFGPCVVGMKRRCSLSGQGTASCLPQHPQSRQQVVLGLFWLTSYLLSLSYGLDLCCRC